jgi:hypothetical protein
MSNTIEVQPGTFVERLASQRLTFVGVTEDGYDLYSDLGLVENWEAFYADFSREMDALVADLYGCPTA